MMIQKFKKGQMVPKRLKMAIAHRRAQHRITFGCDVIVHGRKVSPVTPGDGPIFLIPYQVGRRRNNGTWQKFDIAFEDIFISNAGSVFYIAQFGKFSTEVGSAK